MLTSLASYPNSRVKPRSATEQAFTLVRAVNVVDAAAGSPLPDGGVVTANGNTQILPADPDRTYIELQNTHETQDIVYAYSDLANMEQADNGIGGFLLRAGASISLESKGPVFCKSKGANVVTVNIDIGRG